MWKMTNEMSFIVRDMYWQFHGIKLMVSLFVEDANI